MINAASIICFLSIVLMTGLSSIPVSAQSIRWEPLAHNPAVSDLLDVVILGRGDAIAVGRSGAIHVARNGVNFEAVSGRYRMRDYNSVSGGVELEVLAGGDDGLVALSTDAGKNWQQFETGIGDVNQVADLPGRLTWLLASEQGVFVYRPGMPLSSVHGGTATAVVQSNDSTCYAGFDDGSVLKSSDNGKTWIRIENPDNNKAVLRLRLSGSAIIVVRAVSIDIIYSDTTYRTIHPPLFPNFRFTDAAIVKDALIATGESFGSKHVFTTDFGKEWNVAQGTVFAGNAIALSSSQFVSVGQRGSSATSSIDSVITKAFRFVGFGYPSVYASPTIYKAITGNPRVFTIFSEGPQFAVKESLDSGKTYNTLFDKKNGFGLQGWGMLRRMDTVVVLADSFKVVFDGSNARESSRYVIYSTHDGGASWDTVVSPRQDMKLTKLIRARDGRLFVYGGKQILVSTNGGTTFDSLTSLPFSRCDHFGVLGNFYVAAASTLFRSIDGAKSWQPISFSIGGSVRALTVTPSGRILVALNDMELGSPTLRIAGSDDLGQTWTELTKSTLANQSQLITGMSSDSIGQVIVTLDAPIVYYSLDNGTTWFSSPVPVSATANVYSGQFASRQELVLVGNEDVALYGVVSATSGIEWSLPSLNVLAHENLDIELLELRIFTILGESIAVHQSRSPFTLRDVLTAQSYPNLSYAVGKDVNGRVINIQIIRDRLGQ